ncbi:MAG: rhomboid family intramembrane serine protease [Promethearchaeota archaeon]
MMILDAENLKDAKITLILIFLNIGNFFIFNLVLPKEYILNFVQINRNIIYEFQYWRLITSIFLHADLLHLFSNMIALLLFGATIENNQYVSKLEFTLIYFISGLIGNLFTLILLPIDAVSLGASGAIFGLIGSAFVIVATENRTLLPIAILYITYYIFASFSPEINIWAHIFGLISGIVIGYIIYSHRKKLKIEYY